MRVKTVSSQGYFKNILSKTMLLSVIVLKVSRFVQTIDIPTIQLFVDIVYSAKLIFNCTYG